MPAWLQQKLWSLTDPLRVDQAELLKNIAEDLSGAGPLSSSAMAAIFSLFERFPGIDANGAFHNLSRLLEEQPATLASLVRSLQRQPSVMGLRLLNVFMVDGVETCDGLSLKNLLRSIYLRQNIPEGVVQEAKHLLALHNA